MCGLITEQKTEAKAFGNGNGAISNGNGDTHSNGKSNNHHEASSNYDVVVNLDRGDPKMYYPFWKKMDDECVVTIKASELMSYFADATPGGCFYQMPEFTDAIKRIHGVVGNAVTDGRYIIGGTGSSQLFSVALRALASTVDKRPIPVVCAEPYYSCYEEALVEEKSEIYQWGGDAKNFNDEGPYIEVVTNPNNPDGTNRKPVVNKPGGLVICDLAYYWPQYTPITEPMNYDIMLFTLSKATGHAGSRVGWAIVKDKNIAANMIKQMSLVTIGTCREGQFRATKILEFVADSYDQAPNSKLLNNPKSEGLFEFGQRVLAERWEKLRDVVSRCGAINLLDFPPEYCNFRAKVIQPNPAYAWMEANDDIDLGELLNVLNIRTRAGPRFGASRKYTRVSLLESDETFNLFLERLAKVNFRDNGY